MLSDVMFGFLKQIRHQFLGQPDGLILKAHVYFDPAVFRLIDQEQAPAGFGIINGYQIFAHNLDRPPASAGCVQWGTFQCEFPFQGIIDGNQGLEVGPSQLCNQ